MTTRLDPRRAVIRPLRRPAARRTLVCLGFCGGGTGAYRGWGPLLDEETDFALVCYPGREARFAEDFAPGWEELAEDTTEAVRSAAGELPYVLFGHSMGGWMAYDVATRLERRGGPLPQALIVSSCNAPYRGVTERDRFPRAEDGDEDLLLWMRTSGSLPDYALEDADLRRMAIDLMRADVRVRDSYRPSKTRTSVPVQVLYGADDPVIEPRADRQWAEATSGTLRADRLPGGHFYTPAVWEALPAHFAALTAHRPTPG
ncbi:alpha/beta fold hydrolase [Streptomyces spectabilis]|uniref:thioesterase II family protein n=1 Tax=Streptomyces spectabilis TaxID=68270 RepID=UPI0033DB685E